MIDSKTRLVGVIGWPVDHSLSPPMQNAAIAALGLNWVYVAMPVAPEALAEAIGGARALGFVGLNVTIPHKQAVAGLMDRLDPAAEAIGAVNTVVFTPDGTLGHNTDAEGYTATVEAESDFRFQGQTVLQLGAGGVGRAMAAGAAAAGAGRVLIHARRPEKASELATSLAQHYPKVIFEAVVGEAALAEAAAGAGLIANATPLGMRAGDDLPLPERLIGPGHTVFDTVYIPARTRLLEAARARGAQDVEGVGMLVRQGARSLAIWSGLSPDASLMERVLRGNL